jgi:hypothetical protein
MGNKDRRSREVKKPKKKTVALAKAPRAAREDFNQAAFKAVQETIRRNES